MKDFKIGYPKRGTLKTVEIQNIQLPPIGVLSTKY